MRREVDIVLHWIDASYDTSYIDTGIDLTSTWQEFDPVDLSGISGSTWSGDIRKVWFEFSRGSHSPASNLRIGWIRLTE